MAATTEDNGVAGDETPRCPIEFENPQLVEQGAEAVRCWVLLLEPRAPFCESPPAQSDRG